MLEFRRVYEKPVDIDRVELSHKYKFGEDGSEPQVEEIISESIRPRANE